MTTKILIMAGFVGLITACNHNEPRYLDLSTGENVDLVKNDTSGVMVNSTTRKPVKIYVDTKTHDTIFGSTGKVINGHVVKTSEGDYTYDGWNVKQDGDEYKAKSGDEKIKMEGDEGKLKDGSYTRKVEGDGDVKIETGSKQIKIDGETGERKVKKDKNITDKVKKIFH
jgi:hypothetical protein